MSNPALHMSVDVYRQHWQRAGGQRPEPELWVNVNRKHALPKREEPVVQERQRQLGSQGTTKMQAAHSMILVVERSATALCEELHGFPVPVANQAAMMTLHRCSRNGGPKHEAWNPSPPGAVGAVQQPCVEERCCSLS